MTWVAGCWGHQRGPPAWGAEVTSHVAQGEVKRKRTRASPFKLKQEDRRRGAWALEVSSRSPQEPWLPILGALVEWNPQTPSVKSFLSNSLLICTKCKHWYPLRQQWYVLPSFSASWNDICRHGESSWKWRVGMRRPGGQLISQLLPESLWVNHCVNRYMSHPFLYRRLPQAWAMNRTRLLSHSFWGQESRRGSRGSSTPSLVSSGCNSGGSRGWGFFWRPDCRGSPFKLTWSLAI